MKDIHGATGELGEFDYFLHSLRPARLTDWPASHSGRPAGRPVRAMAAASRRPGPWHPPISPNNMFSEAFSVRTNVPTMSTALAARHVYNRLFFFITISTVLLAIAYAESGDTWMSGSTFTYSTSPSSTNIYYWKADLLSYSVSTPTSSGGTSYSGFLEGYLRSCTGTNLAPALNSICISLSGAAGITIFVRGVI